MATTTANEALRDAMIAHRVDLLRLSSGMASRLVAILNREEPALRRRLRARLERAGLAGRDPGPVTTKRLQDLQTAWTEINRDTWTAVNALARDEFRELVSVEAGFAIGAIEMASPVALSPRPVTADQLRAILTHTPIDGAPLSDWLSRWRANDRRRAMDQIRTGALFGETPLEISRRIFGTYRLKGTDGVRQVTRRGALTLAQTVSAAMSTAAMDAVYQANADIIDQELYVATLDGRTTPICRSLDGRRFDVGEGPKPPMHPNCRSVRVPVIDGQVIGSRPAVAATERQLRGLRGPERRRAVAELVGQVPAQTTYQQWLQRQPARVQDEILGPTRGRLFRSGGLELPAFVDETGRQYTIPELRERAPGAFRRARV